MPNNKIACIIHSLSIGGMERVMSILLNDFAGRDNTEVHLVLIGRKREIHFDLNPNIIIHKPSFSYNKNARALSSIKTMYFIRTTIKEIEPNSILSFGEYWNNIVLLSLAGLRFPVFISDRSQPNKNLGKAQNFLRNHLYPKAQGFIAQTEKASLIARQNKWNKNIITIGNPIRTVSIDSEQPKENWVLTVGRLIKTKHIDQLINIFAKINLPNWKLIIVGGDAKQLQLSKEYTALIKTLQMEDRIVLEGEQSDIDIYYQKSKIFAFVSSSEGFPNVLGEAISAGLPVISYDCVAGPSDLIDNDVNGFLIPERQESLYITQLRKLMESEALRSIMGYKSEEKSKEFNTSHIANQFYQFIKND